MELQRLKQLNEKASRGWLSWSEQKELMKCIHDMWCILGNRVPNTERCALYIAASAPITYEKI